MYTPFNDEIQIRIYESIIRHLNAVLMIRWTGERERRKEGERERERERETAATALLMRERKEKEKF